MKNEISNRKINSDGSVIFNYNGIFQHLFNDLNSIEKYIVDDCEDVQEYNKWAKIYNYPILKTQIPEIDHTARQDTWFMPDEFKNIDIENHILNLCKTQKEIDRVNAELIEFKKRNLYNLLRYLIYLVSIMKENNVVWGIGRGSSVASYCLYLIEVHKVDALKYSLDIKEFLK